MDRENSVINNNVNRIRELISRLDTEHRLTISEYEEIKSVLYLRFFSIIILLSFSCSSSD